MLLHCGSKCIREKYIIWPYPMFNALFLSALDRLLLIIATVKLELLEVIKEDIVHPVSTMLKSSSSHQYLKA